MYYNFHTCKICSKEATKHYRLREGNVFVCSSCGFHYIDWLDEADCFKSMTFELSLEDEDYITNSLQSNKERFMNHLNIVKEKCAPLKGLKVLDIGCGGGLFLSLIRDEGAYVFGAEVSEARIAYSKKIYGISVFPYPVEHDFWQSNYCNAFDVVTLWDVIEHVNFPMETLRAAVALLKPGGLLLLDTPCRDAFYHNVGTLTYNLSMGKFPTFLNSMYSNQAFGHKQIFASWEIKKAFDTVGINTITIDKFHELSFPYKVYLKKILRSTLLVVLCSPMVDVFFKIFKIRNKLLAIGKKVSSNAL